MAEDNLQAVIDVARAGATYQELHTNHGAMHVLVHDADKSRVEKIDLETGALHPFRKRGTVQVFDSVSLNTIMGENAGGNVTVYVDRNPTKPAIVAVLNGAGRDGAGWGDHRAAITFRPTPQWLKWTSIDGKMLAQTDFANFIEDNLLDVKKPAAGDMLEISQFFEVTRTTSFKSVTRPKAGLINFKNEQSDQTSNKSGAGEDMEVPDTITLFLAPMFGGTPMNVTARFRYRIENGTLKLGVKLQRIEEIMSEIIEDFVSLIVLPEGAVMVEGVAP
jgi:uncharacterized protein YfdQ (DUF2303 family)